MALDNADRMTIESITGPIGDDQDGAAERAIEVYGTARAAALHLLLVRRGQLTVTEANRQFGDDRIGHADNFAPLSRLIDETVTAIEAYDADDLTDEGTALVQSARGDTSQGTVGTLDAVADKRRRAG